MNQRVKKLLFAVIRWGIAVVGVWIVVANMTMRDAVLLLNPQSNLPQRTVLAQHADEDAQEFLVVDPDTGKTITVPRSQIINPPPLVQKTVTVLENGQRQEVQLLGMRLSGDINRNPRVDELLIRPKGSSQGQWISPATAVNGFQLKAPRPRVTVGINFMVQHANLWLLLLAILVFPTNFVITGFRWHRLLQAIDINMGFARAFVINMVGAFYNTFLLGSTGGDVIKAYYASRQTTHKTRAVLCVFIDRVVGLLAIVIFAGVMATIQYTRSPSKTDPTAKSCLYVALICVAIMGSVGVMLAVAFHPAIRTALGLEFILNRLPMQRQVTHAREVVRMYQRRPALMLWAVIITLPVHMTTVVSALLAGKAFGLPIQPLYYFTVVPMIVLAGSVPISPQGAGIMEAAAYGLMQNQGGTANDVVALTMSIRVVQILWNLTGAIFVLRGDYHAPTESEQKELEQDAPDDAQANANADQKTQV